MKVHELKILPKYFYAVANGTKKFEIRYNDRDFKVGDILCLKECYFTKYTGREIRVKVTYIIYGNKRLGLQDDYCVMSIERI